MANITEARIERFLEEVSVWARTQPDIVALILVGSHARCTATDDSDVDLMILVEDVAKRIANWAWIFNFGEVRAVMRETWGRVETIRVFYENSIEAEFNLATSGWAEVPLDKGTFQVVRAGISILYDPSEILRPLQTAIKADVI